jgi:hypothetical protein
MYPLDRSLGGPQRLPRRCEAEKNLSPCNVTVTEIHGPAAISGPQFDRKLYCDMSTSCWVARQGLRSGALLGSRPLRWCGEAGSSPRSRDDVTCVYMVARRGAAILSDTTVGRVLMVRRPATASETTQ